MIDRIKAMWNKYGVVVDFLFMLVLTGVAVSLAFNYSVWLDESLSMRWSAASLKNMMGILIPDVHPPLHYIMLHFVQLLTGGNLIAAKLFCVAGFLVMLFAGYILLRKEAGRMAFYFYGLFLISLPFMLVKTVEIRMYSWSMAFAVLTGMAMYGVMKTEKRKYWVYFTIAALASAYNHYYGVITMVFVYAVLLLFFIIHRNGKQLVHFLICCMITIVGYLPWLPIALRQISTVNGDYWIKENSIMGYLKELFRVNAFPHSTKIYCGIISLFTIILLYHLIKEKSTEAYWGLTCTVPFWGVLAFGVIYGKLIRPVMISRYLIIPLVLLILGISMACKYIYRLIPLSFGLFFTCMTIMVYPTAYHAEYDTNTEKTLNFIKENVESGESIIYSQEGLESVILYYLPDSKPVSDSRFNYDEAINKDMWYFDTIGAIVKLKPQEENGTIKLEEYQGYGFDNVNFDIYKIKVKKGN